MSKYKYPVTVEIPAMMSADGEVFIEEQLLKVDMTEPDREVIKDHWNGGGTYMFSHGVTTTVDVARELMKERHE